MYRFYMRVRRSRKQIIPFRPNAATHGRYIAMVTPPVIGLSLYAYMHACTCMHMHAYTHIIIYIYVYTHTYNYIYTSTYLGLRSHRKICNGFACLCLEEATDGTDFATQKLFSDPNPSWFQWEQIAFIWCIVFHALCAPKVLFVSAVTQLFLYHNLKHGKGIEPIKRTLQLQEVAPCGVCSEWSATNTHL